MTINKKNIDLRQTDNYSKYMQLLGWESQKIGNTYIYLRKFLFAKIMKIQRPENLNTKDIQLIESIAQDKKVFHIIIEPKSNTTAKLLVSNHYKQTKPYVPSKTLHIDLKKTNDQLLKEMSQKNRYNIKIGMKNGIIIKNSNEIKKFVKFWNKCAIERNNFPQTKEINALWKAFKNKNTILCAFKNTEKQIKKLIAAVFLIHTNNISYYMYAASSKEGKKLFAPTLLVWKAIKTARKNGSEIFDFEGIYDQRFPLSSWLGFTKFKLGFGGTIKEYPGSFAKWRLPI